MARKLRKGKVSPLDPDKQSKKKEAAKRKVARNDAKDKAPPKGKKAKAKAKAKPKTKAKAKVGTPKIASALGIASRAGPAVLASIAAAAGGVKLLGAGFSYATRGGKVRKADSKLLARQDRLSKAVGKQPGPVGEFSKVSGRKAPPKGAVDRVEMDAIPPKKKPRYTSATFDTTGSKNWIPSRTPVEKYVEEGAAKPAAKPAVKREAKPAAKEVKAVTADSPGPKKKPPPVKAKKAVKPAAKEEPVPAKTESVAKKKEAVTTTKKGKPIPPRKPKSEFFSSTRKAIRTGTEAPKLTAPARGGLLKKPLVATEPFNLEAPSSKMKTAQRLDFDKFNKSSKIGQKMDDSLRRFFSFMPGVLPESTAEGKWKRK